VASIAGFPRLALRPYVVTVDVPQQRAFPTGRKFEQMVMAYTAEDAVTMREIDLRETEYKIVSVRCGTLVESECSK
jgi:hypothetical protein